MSGGLIKLNSRLNSIANRREYCRLEGRGLYSEREFISESHFLSQGPVSQHKIKKTIKMLRTQYDRIAGRQNVLSSQQKDDNVFRQTWHSDRKVQVQEYKFAYLFTYYVITTVPEF